MHLVASIRLSVCLSVRLSVRQQRATTTINRSSTYDRKTYRPRSLVKKGDNALGKVRLSVCWSHSHH